MQPTYTIPATAVNKLAVLGKAMLTLAEEIRQHAQDETNRRDIPVLTLVPPTPIPPDEAWFWSANWQGKEQEANEDIQAGRISVAFETVDDLFAGLHASL
jgi:hypothetical protein